MRHSLLACVIVLLGMAAAPGWARDRHRLREAPTAPMRRGRVVGLSFVPLPGLPSLVQGDPGGAACAWALAAPPSILWVAAVQSTAQYTEEAWLVSIGGAYAVTVVANQLMGLRSSQRGQVHVAVVPTRAGTATATVLARF